jgi:hypothetical protein
VSRDCCRDGSSSSGRNTSPLYKVYGEKSGVKLSVRACCSVVLQRGRIRGTACRQLRSALRALCTHDL